MSVIGPDPDVLTVDGRGLQGGTVTVGGFKHALVTVLAAAAARRGQAVLDHVPAIRETEILCALLASLGARIARDSDRLEVDCSDLHGTTLDPTLSGQIHGSIYLVPALLAGLRSVRFAEFGGCRIAASEGGLRPLSHVLRILEAFGARFVERAGWVEGWAERWDPASIDVMTFSERPDLLTGPLVSGATKTALLAALGVPDRGRTVVLSPYRKPDVTELLAAAAESGCEVDDGPAACSVVTPTGPPQLVRHRLVSDLSQIITFTTLAMLCRVSLTLRPVTVERARAGLRAEIALLDAMGIELRWGEDCLVIQPPERIRSIDIEVTSVGIYSDHQPFFALLLLLGDRPATITEQVWTGRFGYAAELLKLGARIDIGQGRIVVHPSRLRPAFEPLIARDLRGAATLLLAACASGAPATVVGCHHLVRGYDNLPGALVRLGAVVGSAFPVVR